MTIFYYLSLYLFSDRGKGECAVCFLEYGHNGLFHNGTLASESAYTALLTHCFFDSATTTHL